MTRRNIKLVLEYDGTNYCGFQRQKNANSIQGSLERILSRLCNEKIRVIGSGRTDSGVHAEGQVANFYTTSRIPCKQFLRALNGLLPEDISVHEATEAKPSFHARFGAKRKLYRYRVLVSPVPSALMRNFVYHVTIPLNLSLMRKGARLLQGRHDFRSFQAKADGVKTSVRTIWRFSITKKGNLIDFLIEADGFLYNMVRNIVGTLLLVGAGKLSLGALGEILTARDRRKAGPTAPPEGLTLLKVFY
ncbi:MAG: tRNA pseudouridine(38-40) synthase TruA [Candidatus Omnitrophica bacterium]|nr:tRNA pseudouridine(38-40) synthase TruA [Candidatus Omnitrophota bacterium]